MKANRLDLSNKSHIRVEYKGLKLKNWNKILKIKLNRN